jgi:hypothetical protein
LSLLSTVTRIMYSNGLSNVTVYLPNWYENLDLKD